jgi:cobalt/nickel transport system permease protein
VARIYISCHDGHLPPNNLEDIIMHIPDGFLETPVWTASIPIAAIGVAYALRRTSATLEERQIPLLGVTGAFIFAAQMINFPVGPGVSGHLVGGVLAAALLGPHAAALVITVVLGIQALVFQDGGITAFGANIINMALIGAYGGYGVVRLVTASLPTPNSWRFGVAAGAWLSVVMMAVACAIELAASGAVGLSTGLATLGSIHVVIGIGEAVITVGILSFVHRTRPDLIVFHTPTDEVIHETA